MRRNTLAALFLATLCFSPSFAHAQKNSTSIPVQVVFDNSYPGAAVMSDPLGAYVSNGNQVISVINLYSGDLLLNLNNSRKPARYLSFNLSNITDLPATTCPVTSPLKWPTMEPFLAQAFMNVNSVLFVPQDGMPHATGAVFDYTGYGEVRLETKYSPQWNFCSGKVFVTCLTPPPAAPAAWVIESPPIPDAINDGIAVVVQDFSPDGSDKRPVEYVILPFRITVTRQ